MVEEFKSKGLKPNVSGQVAPALPVKTSGPLMRDREPAGDGSLPPAPPHTRVPDPKLSEPPTSWTVLGRQLALASVPHHEVGVATDPSSQGNVWSDWEML